VTLKEIEATDLTLSQVEFTLDDVYNKVSSKEGQKLSQEAKKDM
jgi:hypothetical protein